MGPRARCNARVPAGRRRQRSRVVRVCEVRICDRLLVPLPSATERMPMTPRAPIAYAADLGRLLVARGLRMATAESCTGGLVAAAITDIAGSSDWFERGFVTYSNDAKQEVLGVPARLIETHGAVSEA